MRLKKALIITVVSAILAETLVAPFARLPAAGAGIALAKDFTEPGQSYITWRNEMESGKASSWKSVYGYYSINNNNQGIDFKVENDSFRGIVEKIQSNGCSDIYSQEDTERNMADLSQEKAFLVENQIISRPAALAYSNLYGISAVLRNTDNEGLEQDDSLDRMGKTELYTALYKSFYGLLPSRPVVWKTNSFRDINGAIQPVINAKNYRTTEDKTLHAIFECDYNVYQHANVYELYLTELLNKGIISQNEISEKKTDFLQEYYELQHTGQKPEWYATAKPVILNDVESENSNYLGATVQLWNTDGVVLNPNISLKKPTNLASNSGNFLMDVKSPDYFKQENLTTIDALKVIEKFVRTTEKEMTKTEASVVAYKYGTRYLSVLDSDARDTVSFLIAKGILNFEDTSEYVDLYQDFTYATAYKLLYRVANKDARFDFSKIQLTDNEMFWQELGFAEDEVGIIEDNNLPYMKILEDGETFQEYDDVVKKATKVQTVEFEQQTEPATEPATEPDTEPNTEEYTNAFLYVQCVDDSTKSPLPGVSVTVYNEDNEELETIVTDTEGAATFELEFGSYYFSESQVPVGYMVNDAPNFVEFDASNVQKKFQLPTSRASDGIVNISAVEDGNGVPIIGATISIYGQNGTLIQSVLTDKEPISITLPYGSYTLKLTGAPSDYDLRAQAFEKTIKLSELNRDEDVAFAVPLKSTLMSKIINGMHDTFWGVTAYAATKGSYVIKVLLEDKEGYTYTYGSTPINSATKKSDNDDLNSNVVTKTYANCKMFQVTFKIKADSRENALGIVNAKLKVSGIQSNSKVIGVTEVEGESGEKTTMVSAEDIKRGMPKIKVVNNNTLMNVDTGATALLLPEQGYALVGNKVIVSDNIAIATEKGDVYYNLQVICAIMSNAMIKKINGATSLISSTIKNEKLFDVYSENGTKLEANYVSTFKSVVFKETTENGEVRKRPLMYNMDAMTSGISCLTRNFVKRVQNTSGNSATSDITMIVDWNFVVPFVDTPEVQNIRNAASSDTITYQTAANVLNTEPKDTTLKEWWNYNLDMSNALANFMYGTTGVQYVTCGYLVPSVTVLSSAGGNRKDAVAITGDNIGVTCSANSLSDSQLNNFFKGLSLKPSYVQKYLGGTKTDWWKSYYNVTGYDSMLVKSLMSRAKFKNLAGEEVHYGQDASNATTDGHVYGNAEYLILRNGTVYANAESDTHFTINTNKKRITVKDTSTGGTETIVGAGTKITMNNGGQNATFEYCSTESIGDATYYKLRLTATDGAVPVYFSGYLNPNSYNSMDDLRDAVKNPGYYRTQLGMTLYEYEKSLYQFFGITELPFENLSLARRFALSKDHTENFIDGSTYLDFCNDGALNVRFYRYSDGTLSDLALDELVTENGSRYTLGSMISANTYVYLPTSEFYFAKTSNGSTQLLMGSDVGILNTRVYYVSLNNALRDSILAKAVGTVPVNKIAVGAQVYIGNILFTKQKDGSFTAGPLKAEDGNILGILSAIDKNDAASLQAYLLKAFGTQCVVSGSKNIALQSFITNAEVGPNIKTSMKNVLFFKNGNYYYTINSKKDRAYVKGSCPNLKYYNLRVQVDDALLCRPINGDDTLYQMLYYSTTYVDGLGSLPFYPEYLGDEKDSSINAYWKKTGYVIHQYADTLKEKFNAEYRKAFQGDLVSLFKMIMANVLLYLMAISWICLFFLKTGIGRSVFTALARPTKSLRNGIDVIHVLSLGLFHYDDDPSVSRVIIMNFIFYCIMYLLLDVL